MPAEAPVAPRPGGSDRRRGFGRRGVPAGLSLFDGALLVALLLAVWAGVIVFGAVRFWIAGGLVLLVVAAGAMLLLRASFFPDVRRVQVPPGGWVWAVFLVYAAVRIPAAASPYEARAEWLQLMALAAAYWTAADVGGAGRRWRAIWAAVLVLITLVAWYAIVQDARGSRVIWGLERPEGYAMRASGTYFCPNHFANLLAIGMSLGLALLLTPEVGLPLKLLGGYGLAVSAYPLVLSQSRSGWIGAAVGLATTALLCAWRRGRAAVLVAAIAVPVVLAAAGAAAWSLSPAVRERVDRAIQGHDVRPTLWRNTLALIRERPLLGHGAGSFRYEQGRHQTYTATSYARYAHNEFLNTLAEYGAIGFALLAAFVGTAAFRLMRCIRRAGRARDAGLAAGLLGAVAGSLAHAFFDFNFHIFGTSLLLFAVAGTTAGVLFGGGALAPWFPRPWPSRLLRGLGLLAAVFVLGWTLPSFVSAVLVPRAQAAHEAMNDRRAEDLYRWALRFDPGNWEPSLGLANQLRVQAFWNRDPADRRKLLDDAVAFYERCLAANPRQVEARHGIGVVRNLLGDRDGALEAFRAAVAMAPRHPYYLLELGRQLRGMGLAVEAKTVYQRVVDLQPDPEFVETARANLAALAAQAPPR